MFACWNCHKTENTTYCSKCDHPFCYECIGDDECILCYGIRQEAQYTDFDFVLKTIETVSDDRFVKAREVMQKYIMFGDASLYRDYNG